MCNLCKLREVLGLDAELDVQVIAGKALDRLTPTLKLTPEGQAINDNIEAWRNMGWTDSLMINYGYAEGENVMLEELIKQWHCDRNLIDGSTDKDQFLKLIQECGELSDNLCKGNDIRDDIGDIIVVLINIAERNNLNLTECMQVAYNDIKDRKGVMIDGVFCKRI